MRAFGIALVIAIVILILTVAPSLAFIGILMWIVIHEIRAALRLMMP